MHSVQHIIILVSCFHIFIEEGTSNAGFQDQYRFRVIISHFTKKNDSYHN